MEESSPNKTMCLIYFVVLAYLAASGLAIWLLPHWLSFSMVVFAGIVLIWVIWKIMSFVRRVKTALGDLIPQETLCTVAVNEPFKGNGFAFTFPVACDVSQTKFHEVEALILKPKFDFPGRPKDTLMVVSTFPPEELKPKINETIEKIFAQVEGKAGEPQAVQVGQLKGELRPFATSKDGKNVRGEAVFMGDAKGSIAWVAIAEGEAFDVLSAKYRELAVLIQRVDVPPSEKPPVDI